MLLALPLAVRIVVGVENLMWPGRES